LAVIEDKEHVMKSLKVFACLLACCLTSILGGQQILAQVSQPAGVATSTTPPANVPQTMPAMPANPWGQLSPLASQVSGTASSAQPNASVPSSVASGDPCAPLKADPRSLFFTPDPLGVAPGGGPDQLTSPATDLKPLSLVIKTCEGGRIIMRVENKRNHSYHIGDEIPISIKILADDGVQFNFTSLNQLMLGFEGSDFQLIPVRVVDIASRPYSGRPHSTLYGIELAVQTFITRPMVPFNLDLKYAVDVPPGVTQPNWRMLTTPDFVITNSPVVVGSDDELEEGDLSPVDMRLPLAAWPLTVFGLFLVVWFGFLRRLVIRFNRKRPGRIVPPNETAWSLFAKVFSDAEEYGEFSDQYLRKIDAGLRKYLAQTTKMRIESLSIKELAALMEDDPRLPAIVSVLEKCESVLYARADQPLKLSEEQINEMYAELKQLVPQPEVED
jgi:hypothetical protein